MQSNTVIVNAEPNAAPLQLPKETETLIIVKPTITFTLARLEYLACSG